MEWWYRRCDCCGWIFETGDAEEFICRACEVTEEAIAFGFILSEEETT